MKEKEPAFCPICKNEMYKLTVPKATYMCWHCNVQFVKRSGNITGYLIDKNGNLEKKYKIADGKVVEISKTPKQKRPPNNSRAVQQINSATGGIINTYYSIAEASRRVGKSAAVIKRCCQGLCHQAGGFVWRYADEEG